MNERESSQDEVFALNVVRTLAASGHRALFAGGCVRDRLLGKAPKDFDVATSARPEEVMRLFPKTIAVGLAFGVVRVLGPERQQSEGCMPPDVEVATFRSEDQYMDGRHPEIVTFSNEIEDVKRRDFTINGLLFDPLRSEVLDYVGGLADLKARVVRAIGDPVLRFQEDRLRLMRCVRFAANLGFAIEAKTLAALKAAAGEIGAVSPERIRDELSRMLTGQNPRLALELLEQTGLLSFILPEVAALRGVRQPPEFHPEGDVWMHTLLLLGQLQNAALPLALGALLHDIGKPPTFTITDRIRFNEHEKVGVEMTEAILRRLRYPNGIVEQVCALVGQHMVFKDVRKMREATLKRFLRQKHFEDHLELHRLDCNACHGMLDNYEFCIERKAHYAQAKLKPPPLVTGRDLIALGLTPGPAFGAILTRIEDLQLEEQLQTREEALNWLKEHRSELGEEDKQEV